MKELLIADFEKVVGNLPDNVAIEESERSITYRELNIRCNRLAWALKAAGVTHQSIVITALPSGIGLAASLLSIFKAGGIYLPIDLAFTKKRIAQIFHQTECRFMITTRELQGTVQQLLAELGIQVDYLFILDETAAIAGCIQQDPADVFDGNICNKNPDLRILPEDSCYIFYTSGSTGEAKAFVGLHRSLHHFIAWERQEFGMDEQCRVSQLTQSTFDASLRDIFVPLTTGGTLCIPPAAYRGNMAQLVSWIEDSRITLIHCVPSLFRLLTKEIASAPQQRTYFPTLKQVLMAGEILYGRDVQNWQETAGRHTEIVNLYGTSETTLAKTFHRIETIPEDPGQAIHVGKPITGAFIAIINSANKLCRIGEIGEVYIKTPYMTKGYFKNETLTKKIFVQNPLTQETDIIYKTGDLGRYLPDRSLEVLGRLDEQVKISGIRVELNEIKQAVLAKDGVNEAFITTHKNRDEQHELICYYVGNQVSTEALRDFLQTELSESLIPSYFIEMEEFPLTLNGKVDKKALPKPDSLVISEEEYEAPVNDTEARLDAIYQEVLGLKRVGRKVSFFKIGGTSLKAMQVISRIYKELDVSLKIADIFSNPAIAQLAAVVAASRHTSYEKIVPVAVREHYEVSHAQKRLWILDKLEEGQIAYNMPAAVMLTGIINREAFATALEKLVARHESLRTVFITIHNEPRQQVLPAGACGFSLEYEDLREATDREAAARQLVEQVFNTPFDLETGPLFRARLIQLEEEEYVFVYTIHHIISDGWSMEVLVNETLALYNACVTGAADPLAPLTIQYKDYAAWQHAQLHSDHIHKHRDYWLQQFSGPLPVLDLPADHPRPALLSSNGDLVKYTINKTVSHALKELGKQQEASLFMVLLTTVKALLYRYTGQEDLIIGSPAAGRDHYQLEDQIGFYVNTLVLRTQFSGSDSFSNLLKAVKTVTLGAYDHQLYPFDRLVDDLNLQRDMSRSPLFDVMVALENVGPAGTEQKDFGGITVKDYPATFTISKFDLSFDFYEYNEEILLRIEYNTDLYHRQRIERMAGHLIHLLNAVTGNSSASLNELVYLPAAEQQQLLIDFNNTAMPVPAATTILDLFAEQVSLKAESPAIVSGDDVLTYEKLDYASNRLAHYLLTRYQLKADDRIGIMVGRSPAMVVYLLAILKAGAAYVPIDPAYPEERIRYMIADSGIKMLLTDQQLDQRIHGIDCLVINPAICLDEINIYKITTPDIRINNRDLAYVIYTSGSTGQPKGVMVEHRNLLNISLGWRSCYGLDSFSVSLLQMASMSFDVFCGDVCRTLLNGGKMIIVPAGMRTDPEALYSLIDAHRVNIFESTPALIIPLMDHIHTRNQDVSFMKLLIMGSDTCRTEDFREIQQRFGSQMRILNSYGTTETTIDSSYYEASRHDLPGSGHVPIGKPMSNTQYYILDKSRQPLPIGVPGELYIGGDGVARGYLNRDSLNAERFLDNPFLPGARMYKTGDMACWREDGTVSFLGRNDLQVKLRGYRIEPGEIESALAEHPQVTQAVVLLRGTNEEDHYLAAYYTATAELPAATLRAHLRERLPEYMLPSSFMELTAFPLTVNGKIDYRSLPDATAAATDTANYAAPRNITEGHLVRIWEDVLGRKGIGIADNFFEIGGHSLKATRVLAQIHKVLQVRTDLRTIFAHPTIAGLAHAIVQSKQAACENIIPVAQQEYYDVSHAQKRLWILDQFEAGQTAYNLPGAFILEGTLDVTAFERALATLIERHEVLRTSFVTIDGTPKQKIHTPEAFAFHLEALDVTSAPQHLIDEQVQAAANTCFDLENGPLLKASLLQQAEDKYVFLLTMHHIISDGWSMEVLVNEVLALYNAYTRGAADPLAPLNIQYKDYTAWQHAQLDGDIRDYQQYWLTQLSGELPVLNLPTDYARPALLTANGDAVKCALDKNLSIAVKQFGNQRGVSLFMVLLSAVKALLYRYTGQQDLIIGSPVAGRDHYQLEDQIGFYINTLALRTVLEGAGSFDDLVERVKEATLGAYDHQLYPFDRLVDDLDLQRDMSRSPLFDVMVALENVDSSAEPRDFGNIRVQDYPSNVTISKFDLSFDFHEYGDEILLRIEYNTDLYSRQRIERMARHYLHLLNAAIADSRVALNGLSYIPAAERQQLLKDFNGMPVENTSSAATILDLFAEQALLKAHAPAVVYEAETLTYQDLDLTSNRLAHYLLNRYHLQADDRIGIMVERSARMPAYVLGVLKAGAAYVPIDPAYPEDRIRHMITDSGIKVLLTDQPLQNLPPETACAIASPDLMQKELDQYPAAAPGVRISAQHLAYVIYTSGSTGKPKGVMIEHGNLLNITLGWRQHYGLQDFDVRLLQMASISFDVFCGDLCRALPNGGVMIVVPAGLRTDPAGLYELIDAHQVNIFESTPGLIIPLMDYIHEQQLDISFLQLLILGSDTCRTDDFRRLLQRSGSGMRIINSYGTTETTIDSSCYETTLSLLPAIGHVPIGTPLRNNQYYILDKEAQLLPVGITGELYIGGAGVARGYLNQEALTQQRFIENPFVPGTKMYRTGDMACWREDGAVAFLGRNDLQVKLRGYRIELGEIENTLKELANINQAVVVVKGYTEEDRQLVAYYTAAETLPTTGLRSFLRSRLPEYMLPSAFVQLEAFPLTVNGKIDYRSLPDAGYISDSSSYLAPRNETEAALVQIWEEVLGRKNIGVRDNFFETGGHSLKATRVLAQIHKKLQLRTDLRTIFAHPTIEGLATALGSAATAVYNTITPAPEQAHYELSPAQKRLWILDQVEEEQVAYHMPDALLIEGALDLPALEQAFRTVILRHEILRTTFIVANGEPRQKIQDSTSFEFDMTVSDLRHEKYPEGQAGHLIDKELATPFDLGARPLLRARLYRLGNEQHVFLLIMHHIIADGWSMDVLLKEVFALYTAGSHGSEAALTPLNIQYKDYAHWLNEQDMENHHRYWLEQFSGEVPKLDLLTDHPRPAIKTFNGDIVPFSLEPDAVQPLSALSIQQGASLFMLLTAAIKGLLYRYTGQHDITIGTPVAGREHHDLAGQIGLYLNTVALRTKFGKQDSFSELLQKVKQTVLGAYDHQLYPFDELLKALQLDYDRSRSPLADVWVQYMDNQPTDAGTTNGLKISDLKLADKACKFDLAFEFIRSGNRINAIIRYNTDLFKKSTIEDIRDNLLHFLQSIQHNQQISLARWQLLPASCQEEVDDFMASVLK